MNIIDIKKHEVDDDAETVVYNGPPSGYVWRSTATFIKSLVEKLTNILYQANRKFDNLYIVKNLSQRWILFSSKGSPNILFYYYYDSGGYNSYIYVDWNKLKIKDFIDLEPEKQLLILSNTDKVNPVELWKKERSMNLLGSALLTITPSEADFFIKKLSKNLLANIKNIDLTQKNIYRVLSFTDSLKKIGTKIALDFIETINAEFKRVCMVNILTLIKKDKIFLARPKIKLLKSNSIDWPEFEIIERSLNADESLKEQRSIDSELGLHIAAARQALYRNLPDGNWWAIGLIITELKTARIDNDKIQELLNEYKQDIITMHEKILTDEGGSGVQAGLNNMSKMVSVGIDWVELFELIDQNKRNILKNVLKEVSLYSDTDYSGSPPFMYSYLKKLNVDWTEIKIIEKSLRADGII